MSDKEKARWHSDLALIADAAIEAGAVAFVFFHQTSGDWLK
ncbi:3'(2'),5'-bisphosphate nucleotidase CysQ, partial [Rhizobium leguminosarum]